jgi:hypothetical protein
VKCMSILMKRWVRNMRALLVM